MIKGQTDLVLQAKLLQQNRHLDAVGRGSRVQNDVSWDAHLDACLPIVSPVVLHELLA